MANDGGYVELTQIIDPVEAELLVAFLKDGGVDFRINNRMGARMLSGLMPASENRVLIFVREDDLERAQALLEEYRGMESAEMLADDEEGKEDAPVDDDKESALE